MAPLEHMNNPQVGECFLVTFSRGGQRCYQYQGFGPYMAPQWLDMTTNQIVINIPPCNSSVRVNCYNCH